MLASNHKRILRNTGMLYIRMLLVMAVTLYTSRVVLTVLGVEDFGIYHVVAGFVALLGFMQGAMTAATQRYFAFDLGESGGKDLNRIFNTSILIHILLALLIAITAETAGYWFVVTQLTIPSGRMDAALWAYHLAIASFAISVITVPFTALLMAHERMGIFSIIGMLDVLLKLVAVIALQHLSSDKLVTYAGLLLLVSLITLAMYAISNKQLFPHIKPHWEWHSKQFRTMLGYSAWNTWGNLASALSTQGSNVLLNIFFGPAVNAGRSISLQANGALNNFIVNVQAAINPQIIKLYASGEKAAMHRLLFQASKYNFFILFTLALPVLLNTQTLLDTWLVNVPPYTAIFLQLTIIASLIEAFSGPLMTSAQATGHIRAYQTIIGGMLLLTLPITYILLIKWSKPEMAIYAIIGIGLAAFIARLIILKFLISLDIKAYASSVLARSLITAAAVTAINLALNMPVADSFLQLCINTVTSCSLAVLGIFTLGLNNEERRAASLLAIKLKNKIFTGQR